MLKEEFIEAIHSTNLVELTFDSKSSGIVTRTYAPMDCGPSRRSSSSEPKYHFYDTSNNHPVSLSAEQILVMDILELEFSPENIVRWRPNWYIAREWGTVS